MCGGKEGKHLDNRAIGVFDSGMGGLTTVREMAKQMPGESVVYFGDTGRVPYGGRSRDTILRYARQDVAFLRTFDLKAIVIACGTVSSTALAELSAEQDIPVFGVVGPTAIRAAQATRNNRIGIIATGATVRTGAYERLIRHANPMAETFSQACPLFVPLVENGRTRPGDIVIETIVADYLTPMRDKGVDTLVLGCTHYPLLTEVIQNFMGPEVTLLDSGAEVVRQVRERLHASGQEADAARRGNCRWFVSDTTDSFIELASRFLGRSVTEPVSQVAIERY
jgi:glutamate racemase